MIPARNDYPDRAALARGLADRVTGELKSALAQRDRALLAVPGGTTPGPFLEALSHAELDWEHVDVILTDERWVPVDSPRSNFRLLRTTLLQNRAANAHTVPLYRDAPHPEARLDEIDTEIRRLLPIDVCVLGMGTDGHTASLFPNADRLDEALDEACPSAVLPLRAPGADEPRITLTAPVLRAARHIHLLIAGAGKAHTLDGALQAGPWAEAPVRAALSAPGVDVHYAP